MQTVLRSALLAAAVGFSSLAFAATGAQTTSTPASASSAQMHHGMHRMHHGMHHWRGHHRGHMDVLRKLDLTETQRTDIRQMMREEHGQTKPEMKALMQKRMAFENATPGTDDYQTAAQQLAEAEAQAAQTRVTRQAAMRTKIYNELTPEQRTKLASLRSERQTRMQNWHTKRAERAERAVNKAAGAAPASTSGAQR